MDDLTRALNAILPDYLKRSEPMTSPLPSPDSSSDLLQKSDSAVVIVLDEDTDCLFYVDSTADCKSPGGDLCCSEELSNGSSSDLKNSRSSTPLSAIDVFTEFNTIFDQADKMDSMDSQDSILVTLCNPSSSTQGHYGSHAATIVL
jgi:hypothetical protein